MPRFNKSWHRLFYTIFYIQKVLTIYFLIVNFQLFVVSLHYKRI